ncbi:MAG: AEC family transporter [Pseudomonadota bacterium]|nr:AEC family transporter [Pseudomonadota bacterium]
MPPILAVTAPIFIIIAIGFGAVRLELFSKADIRSLSAFVINFALPALILRALSQSSLDQIVNVGYLLAYALGSLAVLLAGIAVARFGKRRPLTESALYGLGMAMPNSAFVGYPIVLQLLGPQAAVALALSMLVENILLLPLGMALLESGGSQGERLPVVLRRIFARLVRNPLMLAIGAGIVLAVFETPLPEPLFRVVDMFAMAAGAAALFAIGGNLVGLKVRGMAGDVVQIMTGKLILHPLAVLAALLLLPPFDPALQTAVFVFACMPMMSIYPILGQRYGKEGVCAATLVATTAASFITISLMLWLIDATGFL